ncbi:MAG: O-antigen ligase family protein [Microvirgula sp.]
MKHPLNLSLPVLLPLLALPALSLAFKPVSQICFYLLVLLALTAMACHKRWGLSSPAAFAREYWPLCLALLLPLASLAATFAHHGIFDGRELEKKLGLALALPIFWLLLQLAPERLRHLQWGYLAGAAVGSGMVITLVSILGFDRSVFSHTGIQVNAVSYANLLMLLGLASLVSLGWTLSRHEKLEMAAKIAVGALALYATLITETRSSWLAVPAFAILLPVSMGKHLRLRWMFPGMLVAAAGLALFIWLEPTLNARLVAGANDLATFQQNPDTSLGIRLQLWNAAWHMFLQEPWFGIGNPVAFHHFLDAYALSGRVTPFVADNFGEPHNDYLAALSMYGLPGLLALLLAYAVPAACFTRRLCQHPPATIRVPACLGLLWCLSYMVFSLPEHMFRDTRIFPLYSVMVVAFLALSRPAPAASPTETVKPPAHA